MHSLSPVVNVVNHNRVAGLDSIRFVCAFIVMIGHYGIGLPEMFSAESRGIFKLIRGIINCSFNGPAAVIVFFVISGFCIHYPCRRSGEFHLYSFYARRLTRILIPAMAAIPLCLSAGLKLEPPYFTVFWSIICEVVYYLLYPIIRVLSKRLGYWNIVLLAYGVSYFIVLENPRALADVANAYVAFGLWTWVIGLPCWLLGCLLAENFERFSTLSSISMWSIRIFVLILSILLQLAKFHLHSVWGSNCITLNAFASVVYIWVGYEIAYHRQWAPWALIEKCGKWSYSLYLVHFFIPGIVGQLFENAAMQHEAFLIVVALLISYCFYLLVEYPSHRLAAFVGRRLISSDACRTIGSGGKSA